MYHSPELRRYQYYIMTDWAGGVYASPSMAGSRAGSVLAGAWAAINYIGQESVTFHFLEYFSVFEPVQYASRGDIPNTAGDLSFRDSDSSKASRG